MIESGSYHLEFVSEPESNGTHMDFYLQKGDNHEAISNAKVTAQVQLPDGTQKSLPLTFFHLLSLSVSTPQCLFFYRIPTRNTSASTVC